MTSRDSGVLVRFWSLDHHRAEEILWPVSPWAKLVFAMEGTLQVETSQQLHVLPPNRALWVREQASHPAKTLGKAKVRTLYFAPTFSVDRQQGLIEVRPFFRELINEACRIGPLLSSSGMSEALASLLRAEVQSATLLPTSIPMPQSEWLLSWTDEFFEEPVSIPAAAYSRRTLERKLLAETGLTLGQWCSQARALIGLRVLATGATVLEAALDAGFETSSGFIQSFRKQFGTTPGKILRTPHGE